jgi:hypothetical protein
VNKIVNIDSQTTEEEMNRIEMLLARNPRNYGSKTETVS